MNSMDSGIFRLIDANADRAAEGLRVVGDITRFVLDNSSLASEWRSLRGKIWQILDCVPGLIRRGLDSRDSVGDVAREAPSGRHEDLYQLARVNIHRSQESLRVLEESLRGIDLSLVPKISELRYRCYDLEPLTLAALDQWKISRKMDFYLYVVLGQEFSQGRDFFEVAEKAIAGGAGAIQLRAKDMPKGEMLQWAYRLRELTREKKVTFIINDHLDIALAVGADGIHLGQEDFPVKEARRIAGPSLIIGSSTHSIEEAAQAVEDGATYINIGPIFKTATKKNVIDPIGAGLIQQITSTVSIPFTVMGGIKLDNVDEVLKSGARRIAVVTAVVGEDDITSAAQAFMDKIMDYVNRDRNSDTKNL